MLGALEGGTVVLGALEGYTTLSGALGGHPGVGGSGGEARLWEEGRTQAAAEHCGQMAPPHVTDTPVRTGS